MENKKEKKTPKNEKQHRQEQKGQTRQLLTQERKVGSDASLLTFGGHLEVFRQMLFRVLGVMVLFAVIVFCFKDFTWKILLAPSEWNFCTYRWIENAIFALGIDFHFEEYHVNLIATDLSTQFMTHITTAIYIGLLCASPYIMYELFCFISPALYDNEKRYAILVTSIIYMLFTLGVLMSYFVLFPISFRFLGTYSVSDCVISTITLDSYVSTFVTLTIIMGFVFQLPVIVYFLSRMGMISKGILTEYRKHTLIIIMLFAAIVTPPDLMTLVLVTAPLYVLYEISIWIVK